MSPLEELERKYDITDEEVTACFAQGLADVCDQKHNETESESITFELSDGNKLIVPSMCVE